MTADSVETIVVEAGPSFRDSRVWFVDKNGDKHQIYSVMKASISVDGFSPPTMILEMVPQYLTRWETSVEFVSFIESRSASHPPKGLRPEEV